ncbi:MAG: hypothetical protein DRI39_01445 [Chloroflexi bacterium]|nr:MAG: hypothetical protein DRI39_01445 [Chloroflexota bacterium]RLC97053.1 MAG: hypothetical protein DRI40_01420 [Chloroflexota bacterium]
MVAGQPRVSTFGHRPGCFRGKLVAPYFVKVHVQEAYGYRNVANFRHRILLSNRREPYAQAV